MSDTHASASHASAAAASGTPASTAAASEAPTSEAPPSGAPASGARAVVVGSGPNGLSAALTLALAGVSVRVLEAADEIGGGTRTRELTVPGLRHDVCSAFHPLGRISAAFAGFGLEAHGLRWAAPPVDLVHVLDGGRGGVLWRDLERTADGLGVDGPSWRRLFAPLVAGLDDLGEDVLGPLLHVPRHPGVLARFGAAAALPATVLARRWRRAETRALFAGVAAHAMGRLDRPLSSAVGVLLTAAGHRVGWPVAVGGSAAITAAMAARLVALGGVIETGVRVDSLAQVGDADLVLLDTTPAAAAQILGAALPSRVARSYRRFRHGPAAFKVDYAVRDGVPWRHREARRAGTVHLGGPIEEVAAAEADVVAGRMPARPFVLVGQQYLADPSRSVGDLHPVWAYAHVPHGYRGDVAGDIEARIEAHAPGFGRRIVARHVTTPAGFAAGNPNYVGGDIAAGAADGLQAVVRPRLAPDPYATGVPGVTLCSASTPPGAGVHGLCGLHAARAALRRLPESDGSGAYRRGVRRGMPR